MNKSMFEEKWKLIRGEINARWNLMEVKKNKRPA